MTSPLSAFHRSNLLTYASLLCGVAAIAAAVEGNPGRTGSLIALAVIFDTLDGRFARLFPRSESQHACGVQLDSLSDAIAFGLAPAACAALFSGGSTLSWIAAFVYAACAVSRLAHYNVVHEQHDGFIGLPVPVAALIWASSLVFAPGGPMMATLILATAIAMVAPLPIPRPHGAALAAFLCWPLLVLAAHAST